MMDRADAENAAATELTLGEKNNSTKDKAR